jgi:septum formation protein
MSTVYLMNKLLLASTSQYRKELLERLRIPFSVAAPGIDEESFKDPLVPAYTLCQKLARLKAESLIQRFPHSTIIASDQMVLFGDEILGKPHTVEVAVQRLGRLSGHYHEILTALAVYDNEKWLQWIDRSRLKMRALSLLEIERYVAIDNPLDCAGAYKIEGLGISLFEKIQSEDFTAIQGLPLLALSQILRELDYQIP